MRWASWINFILGLWLIVSPFALKYSHVSRAVPEDVILGILIAAFSLWMAATHEALATPAWLVVLFGIWVTIAPFVLGYSPQLASAVANDIIVGVVVLVLALVRAVGVGRPAARPLA
jgi:hypothetical protein